jgi:predicted nucleic acid-binding protein
MLDSNVLLSALFFPGETMSKLMYKVTTDHHLVISSYIINELHDVTHRKFPHKISIIDTLLSQLNYELIYTPEYLEPELFEIRDMNDYPTLYSAITESVDVFVTGDKDFDDIVIEKPKIMTPAEFVEKY